MLRAVGVLVASGLVLVVLALGTWRVSTMAERHALQRRINGSLEDICNVRNLVGRCASSEKLPMRDGVLDPYHFVETGDLGPEEFKTIRSNRRDVAPTEEEIRRGDYTHFPWERYRGDRTDCRPPVFPLLWEPEPFRGVTLVGFSDGSARYLRTDELAGWGLAH